MRNFRARRGVIADAMRAFILTAVIWTALAAPAAAKVWFQDMGGQTVRWGERVKTEIPGCADAPGCGDLVGRHRVWMRRDHGRHRWLLARIDEIGRVRFRVPHAPPGRYRLIASDGGGLRAVSTWFRVSGPSSARAASG
jgi:hypothetical protein